MHGRARLVVEGRVRVVRVGGGDAEDAEPGAALAGVLRAVVAKAWRGAGGRGSRLNYVIFRCKICGKQQYAVCIYSYVHTRLRADVNGHQVEGLVVDPGAAEKNIAQ